MTCQQVIRLGSDPVVRNLPPPIEINNHKHESSRSPLIYWHTPLVSQSRTRERGCINILVDGQHDWELVAEVRGDLQEVGTFVQCLLHELVLFNIQFTDGFLQIADSSMNKFRGS